MPAGSEGRGRDDDRPLLPRTYRPLGPRIAGIVAMASLLAVGTATWLAFDDATRAAFTPFQRGTVIVLTLLAMATMFALIRSRAVATADSLVVVNGYRQRRYAWEQIVQVHLGAGAPWATLDLADGRTVSVMGIQGSDGARARAAVRELRDLLDD